MSIPQPPYRRALALAALIPIVLVDWFTPLGLSVWVLYLLPVAYALRASSAREPLAMAAVVTALLAIIAYTDELVATPYLGLWNRGVGVAVIWAFAWLGHWLIVTRTAGEVEGRLHGAQAALLRASQGDLTPHELGVRVLRELITAIGARAGALYASADQQSFTLAASHGVDVATLPATIERGDGLVGEALEAATLRVLDDVPADGFRMSTALTTRSPGHVAILPLLIDDERFGVIELAFDRGVDAFARELLNRIGPTTAKSLRTQLYRRRVKVLLEETESHRDRLQVQQEELSVANEELEEQTEALRASQARLHEQQAELEATNAQLADQAQEMELQAEALAEAAARAEQASRYKSEFLANMSHELRTPLNSVLILARLLADNRGGQLTPEQVRYANTIHASGTHLLTLINDILDLARIESGRLDLHVEDVDVRALVDGLRESFEPLAREKALDFRVEVQDGTPATLSTDGVRLQQVVVNLLSNAMKFTDEGHVRLRVTAPDDARVAFVVEDTGPGIEREKLEVVFEAFRQADGTTQRKYGGSGLGLSISRQLARLLGGDLDVESRVGEGSRFTLVIPTRVAPALPNPDPPAPSAAPATPAGMPARRSSSPVVPFVVDDRNALSRGRLLLVIEDDAAFAGVLCDLAHELEFDCVVAATSDEGFRLACDLRPTGILLDVGLPDGSGLALLDRLKRTPATRHVPVHMLSVDDHSQSALALGAVGYALKPADRETLIESVARIEAQTQRSVRRLLVIEDDPGLRDSLVALLSLDGVDIDAVGTARDALDHLGRASYDCVVLDLTLPDASGFDVLDSMSTDAAHAFPPVIVYTGQALSEEDETRLRRYSRSVIVKGARSPERLLDEVTLFLHRVESTLPTDSQRMLKVARERDELFEGRRVLLAEDDVRNIFALSAVLEPRGATLLLARNGREALDLARREPLDLVLMDVMMAEMDGLTAIREIRRQPDLRDLPIIALTAKARREDREQCLLAGANDYLAKPIDVDKLVSLCRVWMKR